MPKFRFVVSTSAGKIRRGTITEKDEATARQALTKAGFEITSLTEVTEILVHTPATVSGKTRPKPERASIINFEPTVLERIGELFSRYILRREFALLLGTVGLAWVLISWFGGKDKKTTRQEIEFVLYTVSVAVDTSKHDTNRVEIRLPEVPYKTEEAVDPNSDEIQTVSVELELGIEPKRIEVVLKDIMGAVARSEGTLEQGTDGELYYEPDWLSVPRD